MAILLQEIIDFSEIKTVSMEHTSDPVKVYIIKGVLSRVAVNQE